MDNVHVYSHHEQYLKELREVESVENIQGEKESIISSMTVESKSIESLEKPESTVE